MGRPLLWREDFDLGHAGLDAQHRHLVELINEIDGAVQSTVSLERCAALLQTLREAIEEHIRQENAVLWEIKSGTYAAPQDPLRTPHFLKAMAAAAFDEHMVEHAALLARFDAIVVTPIDALCETLKAWFLDHAAGHESRLKAIFQAM